VLETVTIGSLRLERFEAVLASERYQDVRLAADRARELLAGRVVWNVNSTARGGGVAEMLVSLLAYARGAGVDARWVVIPGNEPFFAVTKRIHNNLHSAPGDGGEVVDRRDVVIVHDPHAGRPDPTAKALGVTVIWRCHVGIDHPSAQSRRRGRSCGPTSSRPTHTCSRVRHSSGKDLTAARSS
jgi:trehalose synthase